MSGATLPAGRVREQLKYSRKAVELKVTALQQEQAMSNLKLTVGAKVASRACSIARSLASARSEAAEKSKNKYGLMGICSRKLEEEGERRMVYFYPELL